MYRNERKLKLNNFKKNYCHSRNYQNYGTLRYVKCYTAVLYSECKYKVYVQGISKLNKNTKKIIIIMLKFQIMFFYIVPCIHFIPLENIFSIRQ